MVLARAGRELRILVDHDDSLPIRTVTDAFSTDLKQVTGAKPKIIESLEAAAGKDVIVVGTVTGSSFIKQLAANGKLNPEQLRDQWESADLQIVEHPWPGISRAVIIAGSDARGVAFALFSISRAAGVSPWYWWADVPIRHHQAIWIKPGVFHQNPPSVQYRGIFLNDENFALLPWAAAKMDPEIRNVGPRFYERIFELVLRLHANSVWPAQHPGTKSFDETPINSRLAEKWGIVMGSSHAEILLRNNVGEWDPKVDGPWNYQINHDRMLKYWRQRVQQNGRFENFYPIGLRGQGDNGIQADGGPDVKAKLVEKAITEQRELLRQYANPDLTKVPQVIWLYKEVLDLYRFGIHVPDDVTLGWVDDNYGYIRQMPNKEERRRAGGSGLYYHISYRGDPNDYLWLCTTPPSLIREELTKAFAHGIRKYWVVNVGDVKPGEIDLDYFLQLAWDLPGASQLNQTEFLKRWLAEQFPSMDANRLATMMNTYYHLNFIRRPESMGFNGKNGPVNRTDFNPLAWGDQNRIRTEGWEHLANQVAEVAKTVPPNSRDAWFELIQYPVQAAAALNAKILKADRTYLDVKRDDKNQFAKDSADSWTAYRRIETLTNEYNSLHNGKWQHMMNFSPNDKAVFDKPSLADPHAAVKLPASWKAFEGPSQAAPTKSGFIEFERTVSIAAPHFAKQFTAGSGLWDTDDELGISAGSLGFRERMPAEPTTRTMSMAELKEHPWTEYQFTTTSSGQADLMVHILPTFPFDSDSKLRFAVSIDDGDPEIMDATQIGQWREATDPASKVWMGNVVRNSAILTKRIPEMGKGPHSVRLFYVDPGVRFEHLVLTFSGAPPAYPVPPETISEASVEKSKRSFRETKADQ